MTFTLCTALCFNHCIHPLFSWTAPTWRHNPLVSLSMQGTQFCLSPCVASLPKYSRIYILFRKCAHTTAYTCFLSLAYACSIYSGIQEVEGVCYVCMYVHSPSLLLHH